MTVNQRIVSFFKNLGLLYFLLLVFIFILFVSIILTIPESDINARVVVSIFGSACLFLLIIIILSNANENVIALQRVTQEAKNKFDRSSINIEKSNINSIFTNIINISYKNNYVIALIIGTVFGVILFFLSTSHYLFYLVDNSGSMGTCPNWSKDGCLNPVSSEKSIVSSVTKQLHETFEGNKGIGRTEVPESSLPILPFYKFTPDVKVGLIEIGGRVHTEGLSPCTAKELVEPALNNQKQLLEGLTQIKPNDNGVTALIEALKQADASINSKTSKPLKYAASKNVILFTDGYEDNCNGKTRSFCEATSELPEGFNVKLNIYGIRDPNLSQEAADKKFSCDKFKCGEKYSAELCKVISTTDIQQGVIPKSGLRLSLSPTLTTTSYTFLLLSLICVGCIFWIILNHREELFCRNESQNSYLEPVYLFISSSNRKIISTKKKIINTKNSIIKFLRQEQKIPGFGLLIIVVIFIVLILIIGLLLLFR